MTATPLRRYLSIAAIVLVIDWGLGVARFQLSALSPLFVGLNLPSSLAFVWLERQPSSWWRNTALFDDEVGQIVAFLAMVALQAAIVSYLAHAARRYSSMKPSHSNSR